MSELNEKISRVPSTGSVIMCTVFRVQRRTLFTQLEIDALELLSDVFSGLLGEASWKCITMERAVDILLAQDHRETNNN